MVRDIPYSETTGDPASVYQDGEQSVASRSPCDARGQTFAVILGTEVVPPPSVCSTAVGPLRRTSPLLGYLPPPPRTPAPPVGERSPYDRGWQNLCTPRSKFEASYLFVSESPPTDTSLAQDQTDPEQIVH